MKKQIRPPFTQLIARLVNQIQLRNPKKQISESEVEFLQEKWNGNQEKLYHLVKRLEIDENRFMIELDK